MSQLNFFITQQEMVDKLRQLFSSEEFQIFSGRFFDTNKPSPVTKIDQLDSLEDKFAIWINNEFLEPVCSAKGTGAFEGKFLFDIYYNPIIEVSQCKIIGNLISPGRIYYKTGWIKNDVVRAHHTKTGNKVRRIFNKGLLSGTPPFKISPGTIDLLEKGFEIELGEGGMRKNKNNFNGA